MAIVKMEDVNKTYTEIIGDYISRGYWVYTKTMAGHQGEIAKIDLTNGKRIIRVRIDKKYHSRIEGLENLWLGTDVLRIVVVEYDNFRTETLWNNEGTVINEFNWYQVGRKNIAYVDNLEEYIDIANKTLNRFELKPIDYGNHGRKLLNYNADTIIKIVNGRKGFKSCKKKDIKSVERYKNGYYIRMEGKSDAIYVPFPIK